jgi:hypothetical protein
MKEKKTKIGWKLYSPSSGLGHNTAFSAAKRKISAHQVRPIIIFSISDHL